MYGISNEDFSNVSVIHVHEKIKRGAVTIYTFKKVKTRGIELQIAKDSLCCVQCVQVEYLVKTVKRLHSLPNDVSRF